VSIAWREIDRYSSSQGDVRIDSRRAQGEHSTGRASSHGERNRSTQKAGGFQQSRRTECWRDRVRD